MVREQHEQENFIKKYMTTEVKYIIWIVAFVLGVVSPYYDIKQDVAIIRHNHIAHTEQFAKDILRLTESQNKQQDVLIQLMREIAKMEK